MGHQISVIVPHMECREEFLRTEVLPSIVKNLPNEIIVIADPKMNAQQKRNAGAKMATQPFLFFCDDDVVLRPRALEMFINAILTSDRIGFAYSDWNVMVHPGAKYPYQGGIRVPGGDIGQRLRYESPVCTMCLIRTAAFPGFDEQLGRHQDRDLFLTILKNGWACKYVPGVQVDLHQIDSASITQTENYDFWERYVELKHELPFRQPEYPTPENLPSRR